MNRVLLLVLLVLGLGSANVASAQVLNGSCTSGQNGYTASADSGGNILKCNGTTWLAVAAAVAASGTTGSVQYNAGGLLAGDSNILWNSVSRTFTVNGYINPIDAGTKTYSGGIASEAGSVLVDFGINDFSGTGRFGTVSSSSVQGGLFRVDTRLAAPLFQWLSLPTGSTGAPGMVMSLTASGLLGIGNFTPTYNLDLIGQERVQTSGQTYYTILSGNELFSRNSPLYLNATSTSPTLINPNGGNVGINNSNPAYKFDVNGAIRGAGVAIGSNLANFQAFTPGSSQGERSGYSFYDTFQGSGDNGPRRSADIISGFTSIWGGEYLSFNVGNNGAANDAANPTLERMRIAGNGFVGISTTSPAYTLDVTGNGRFTGSVTQNSDRRLKTNIQQLSPGVLAKLALIKGVTFNWKDPGRDPRQQIGVIAQDVQKAYPQLVATDPSGTLSVNYAGLTAPLIEAVKQLKTENDGLQSRLTATETQQAVDHTRLLDLQRQLYLLLDAKNAVPKNSGSSN